MLGDVDAVDLIQREQSHTFSGHPSSPSRPQLTCWSPFLSFPPSAHLLVGLPLLLARIRLDDPEVEELAHERQRARLGRDLLVGALHRRRDGCRNEAQCFQWVRSTHVPREVRYRL